MPIPEVHAPISYNFPFAGITHAILAAILSRRALVLIVEFSPVLFPESGQV